eukprot:COSAG04_NODE_25239_length_310_cov_0.971564_1_plen_80_part_01
MPLRHLARELMKRPRAAFDATSFLCQIQLPARSGKNTTNTTPAHARTEAAFGAPPLAATATKTTQGPEPRPAAREQALAA